MDPIIQQENEEIQIEEIRLEADDQISSSETLKSNVELLFKYAVNTGKELPTNLILKKNSSYQEQVTDYNALMKVVSPATPESIRYINAELTKIGPDGKWYLIPIYTKCIAVAIFALVLLIGTSLLPNVDSEHMSQGLLDTQNPGILFENLLFILAAALLGVMFYLLKTIGDKIRNSTLLPVDSIELNSSIIIGVISGFIVSEILSFTLDSGATHIELHRITLALLGGFASDVIFTMLQTVVNKFKAMMAS